MSYSIKKYKCCRICGSDKLLSFLQFPGIPLPDCHVRNDSPEAEFTCDLEVFWCENCGVVQTLQDILLDRYYTEYDYTVSASPFVKNFMRKLARTVWKKYNLKAASSVLEIGSGDGEQLTYFKDLGARVLGFEPSRLLAKQAAAKGVHTLNRFFNRQTCKKIPSSYVPADVILLSYTFDHLTQPVEFLNTAADIINKKTGIIIIEVHDLEKIISRKEVCLFCHEHSVYLSIASVAQVFRLAGFKLIDSRLLPEQDCRGNSLIAVGALTNSTYCEKTIKQTSALASLRQRKTYVNFHKHVTKSHKRLYDHVQGIKKAGGCVVGYGVSARSINTILLAGLKAGHIDYICDANPGLHGKLLPVSRIPIKPPAAIINDKNRIDEVLVFNYGYLAEIKKSLSAFIKKGGKVSSLLEFLADG